MMSRSLFEPIQDVAGIVPNPVMVTILTKVANAGAFPQFVQRGRARVRHLFIPCQGDAFRNPLLQQQLRIEVSLCATAIKLGLVAGAVTRPIRQRPSMPTNNQQKTLA